MSKVTNKQIAKVFRKAIKYLGMTEDEVRHTRYKFRWICSAIGMTTSRELYEAVIAAGNIVRKRIDGYVEVTDWLRYMVGIHAREITTEQAQAYRKRWLESLAVEFENK